jgi:hypothetical protein
VDRVDPVAQQVPAFQADLVDLRECNSQKSCGIRLSDLMHILFPSCVVATLPSQFAVAFHKYGSLPVSIPPIGK